MTLASPSRGIFRLWSVCENIAGMSRDGGVPAGSFIDAFHVPTVSVSLADFDDNQPIDDENLRVGKDGLATAIMAR